MGYLQRRGGLRAETLQDKGPYFAWETIQGTVAWPEAEKPARMVKLKTEPVAKRKPNLCPTRCIPPSTVAYLEKESSLEPVTPQYATLALGRGKLSEVSGPQ